MNYIFITVGVVCVVVGFLLFVVVQLQKRQYGVLTKKRIYQDTDLNPGEVLYAKSINIVGKPDYLIKEGTHVIPVEVKTGKTPVTPYNSHIMQLTSYCLLVEECYGITPQYGYIKYPDHEFKVMYTENNKRKLVELTKVITNAKANGLSFSCRHPEHNVF